MERSENERVVGRGRQELQASDGDGQSLCRSTNGFAKVGKPMVLTKAIMAEDGGLRAVTLDSTEHLHPLCVSVRVDRQ